jgi:hypothetical protein
MDSVLQSAADFGAEFKSDTPHDWDGQEIADSAAHVSRLLRQRRDLIAALDALHIASAVREFERATNRPTADGLRRFSDASMAARAVLQEVQS